MSATTMNASTVNIPLGQQETAPVAEKKSRKSNKDPAAIEAKKVAKEAAKAEKKAASEAKKAAAADMKASKKASRKAASDEKKASKKAEKAAAAPADKKTKKASKKAAAAADSDAAATGEKKASKAKSSKKKPAGEAAAPAAEKVVKKAAPKRKRGESTKKASTKKKKASTKKTNNKKKKRKVDKNDVKFKGVADTMPSHPNTGWMLYSQDRRNNDDKLQALEFGEVGKVTGAEWREIRNHELREDANGKKVSVPRKNADGSDMEPTEVYGEWMEKERLDKIRYLAECAALTPLQKQYDEWSKRKSKRAKRAADKTDHDNGKPVHALSRYMFFVQQRRAEIVERHGAKIVEKLGPKKLFAEIGKFLGQYWRQMTRVAEGEEATPAKLAQIQKELAPFKKLNEDDELRYKSQLFVYNTQKQAQYQAGLAAIAAVENAEEKDVEKKLAKYVKKNHKAVAQIALDMVEYAKLTPKQRTDGDALAKVHAAAAAKKAQEKAEAAAVVKAAKAAAKAIVDAEKKAAAEAAAAAAAEAEAEAE